MATWYAKITRRHYEENGKVIRDIKKVKDFDNITQVEILKKELIFLSKRNLKTWLRLKDYELYDKNVYTKKGYLHDWFVYTNRLKSEDFGGREIIIDVDESDCY